jgi:hypothetical protein
MPFAAALDYACHMVRELRANGGHHDPDLLVTVRNEMREIVLSCPFWPPAPERCGGNGRLASLLKKRDRVASAAYGWMPQTISRR